MKIITIPHPSLRKKAKPIEKIDDQLMTFINHLSDTLAQTQKPKGIGLAAPQVDNLIRVFATNLPITDLDSLSAVKKTKRQKKILRYFINPIITKKSSQKTLGEDADQPDLEGCLSMPNLFGSVPRWEWVLIEYQQINNQQLINLKEKFFKFHARVMQHEIDHLDGILFTDHSLANNLPVYKENKTNEKLIRVDPNIIQAI